MGIHLSDPDPRIVTRIGTRVRELLAEEDFADRRRGWPRSGTLELTPPHVVYTMDVKGLARSVSLREARPVATRCLVLIDGVLVAAAELAQADGAQVAVNDGPYVASLEQALDTLESAVGQREGELGVLRVSPLRLVVAWFRAQDGADLFVPLAPAPDELEPRPYSSEEASQIFAAIARRHLSHDVVDEP